MASSTAIGGTLVLTEPGEHPINEETIRQAEENLRQAEAFVPADQMGRELNRSAIAGIQRWLAIARTRWHLVR